MLNFKLNLFELTESIRHGVIDFFSNFLWSLLVLFRHPIRGPMLLAFRFRSAKFQQLSPFSLLTAFILGSLLVLAAVQNQSNDGPFTLTSGHPINLRAIDFYNLVSSTSAILLLLASALFAAVLNQTQRFFFINIESLSDHNRSNRIIDSLGFLSIPTLTYFGIIYVIFGVPTTFFLLLFSGQIVFFGPHGDSFFLQMVSLGVPILVIAFFCALPSAFYIRRRMTRGLAAGTVRAQPLSWPVVLFRCSSPYLIALAVAGSFGQFVFPDPHRLWVSHLQCELDEDLLIARFVLSNQTNRDILAPRDSFFLELWPRPLTEFSLRSLTLRETAVLSVGGSTDNHTVVILEQGKTHHATLNLDLTAEQLSDQRIMRDISGGVECRPSLGREWTQRTIDIPRAAPVTSFPRASEQGN